MPSRLQSPIVASAAFALALALGVASLSAAPAAAKDTVSTAPLNTLTWSPSGFGPDVSPVYGDLSKGEHETLIRFKGGFVSPVHTHSHDYTGVVVTGVTRHYEPGQRDTAPDLPPGSHWAIPGNLPHVSECLPGPDCIMLIFQNETFDIIPQ